MDFSLFFMPLKMKKPVFFTLDPVAALVYNRTDRRVKKKEKNKWINNNNDNDKWNKNYNKLVFETFIIKAIKKEHKKRKWLFLYIKINSFQKNILDLVSKLF